MSAGSIGAGCEGDGLLPRNYGLPPGSPLAKGKTQVWEGFMPGAERLSILRDSE